MTDVACGPTAKKPGSAPCPTLVTQYGTTTILSYYPLNSEKQNICETVKDM